MVGITQNVSSQLFYLASSCYGCGICLASKEPQDLLTLSECKHSFHKKCIKLLMKKSEYELRCPYCRERLNGEKLRSEISGKKELKILNVSH